MPVQRTPQGGYEVRVSVRGRRLHRRLPPGTSAGDARRIEAELRVALERQCAERAVVIPGDPAMVEILMLYEAEAEHLRSPETARHHVRRIFAWCERRRASEARAVASEIVRDMRSAYAPATINRSLGCLKRGLHLAWERGMTREDYSAHVARLPENNQRDTYLEVEQVQAIAEHANEPTRAAIWIALLTGCRRGEVLSIQPADIGRDTILIRAGNTKTVRTRTVPIVPALRPWLKHLPIATTYEGIKTSFRRAREKAGMPEVHFHDLRHSCATILLGLDVPLDVVRDILGHTSIKTTERYAHALVERQREALGKLSRHTKLHQRRAPAAKKRAA